MILGWPFKKYLLWSTVSRDQENEALFVEALSIAQAVWDAKGLKDLLGIEDYSPEKKKSKEEIIKETKKKLESRKFKEISLDEVSKLTKE